MRRCILFALLFGGAHGCAIFWGLPKSPEARAKDERPHCEHSDDARTPELEAAVLRREAVDHVEPLYAVVRSGRSNRETHLLGAIVVLKPVRGVVPEWLEHALKCRQVEHVDGVAGGAVSSPTSAAADDPFWLPGGWIDIGVKSTGDGFAVELRHEDLPSAKEILARAKRFAASVPSENPGVE